MIARGWPKGDTDRCWTYTFGKGGKAPQSSNPASSTNQVTDQKELGEHPEDTAGEHSRPDAGAREAGSAG